MAWRGCGAAAPGSFSACVLHPFPFPENPRSFSAGSPARHPVLSWVPVQFRPTIRMCKHPKRSAANFAPPCCSLGGVRLGTVPLRLVWFAGVCLLSVFCSLRVVGWRGTKTGARHEGHPFRSAGAKWRTLR